MTRLTPMVAQDSTVTEPAGRYADEIERRGHTDATIAQGERIRASVAALRADGRAAHSIVNEHEQ